MEEEMKNICEQANSLIDSLDQDGISFSFIQYITDCVSNNTFCDLEGYKEFVRENL